MVYSCSFPKLPQVKIFGKKKKKSCSYKFDLKIHIHVLGYMIATSSVYPAMSSKCKEKFLETFLDKTIFYGRFFYFYARYLWEI